MALNDLRAQIDRADAQLSAAFISRMQASSDIAQYKRAHGLPVLDAAREEAVIARVCEGCEDALVPYMQRLYRTLFALSREYQQSLLSLPQGKTGLIGHPLGHSCSPQLHALYGDAAYQLWDIAPQALPDFLRQRDFALANVTIPYKQTVLPYCDTLSEDAQRIGSVNTLICRDGRLHGDNTDAFGFAALAAHMGMELSHGKTLVLGSGGTSRTVCDVIARQGGQPVVISRTGENNYENVYRLHADARYIVNATPVGMYPNVCAQPLDLSRFTHLAGVLDAVYHPLRTQLVQQAQALHIPAAGGLYMLCAQAARARQLLCGTLPDIDAAYHSLLRQRLGIALIGMPGAGKSTLSRALAQRLGQLTLVDTDACIVREQGRSIADIFTQDGEAAFRDMESRSIARESAQYGRILSVGGGAALRSKNQAHLRMNCLVVWVQRDLSLLPVAGRPISQSCGLDALYRQRAPLYAACADVAVSNNGTIDACVDAILSHYEAALTGGLPAASVL